MLSTLSQNCWEVNKLQIEYTNNPDFALVGTGKYISGNPTVDFMATNFKNLYDPLSVPTNISRKPAEGLRTTELTRPTPSPGWADFDQILMRPTPSPGWADFDQILIRFMNLMFQTGYENHPETDIKNAFTRMTEAREAEEARQIATLYQRKVSQIPEVQQIVYQQDGKSIEFIVVINQIERNLFFHLSQIESRLCDEYSDWFFEFENIGSRTFSKQFRDEYTHLFSRE